MRGFKDNKDIKKKDLLFSSAFTLVELIVVVVIIAILATIGVVGYSSWRQSTATAQLKSDLNGVAAAMENARTFGNTYPTTIPSTFVPSSGVTLSGGGVNSGKGYCVDATNGTQSYNISSQYNIPTAGPCSVLYFDAGIFASYPGSGTIWTDLSGNGNNGTLVGGFGVNGLGYSSTNGGSLTFDGSDDYVNAGNSSSLDVGSGDFSASIWIYPTSLTTRAFLQKSNTNDGWIVGINGNSNNEIFLEVRENGTANAERLSYNTTIQANTWYHIAVVKTGANIAVYKNGVSLGTQAAYQNLSNSSVNFQIGSLDWWPPGYFQGLISHVSIYNRALSASEITQNFNALRGRYGI